MPRSRRKNAVAKSAPPARHTRAAVVIAAIGALALVTLLAMQLSSRQSIAPVDKVTSLTPVAARPTPAFVGYTACAACHRAENETWQGSQHAHAMQSATPATMLGNFNNAHFSRNGVTSTFFRKDDRYFVNTDGPDGKLADFELKYTFGIYPLQQYLIGFPDGRMQALSIAWDSRTKKEGGNRWFHLYPTQRIGYKDSLHWTRLNQNWNFMCAECHSTNLRRNYDPKSDRFSTTWSDMAVTCEACHGPGSNHVAWAQKAPGWERLADDKGLAIRLDERRGVSWTLNPAGGNATRSELRQSRREIETCAVCHSRRAPIGTDTNPTGQLLDTHDPTLLLAGMYFVDGQQQDEVYIWGSFLQSKMYAKGVTCSDCHDPHTQKLRAPGNAVCAQCHAPATYEVATHLLHRSGSTGAQCAACHMPKRTYMVVDPRLDHSMRIPRPDLTLKYGVPNACNACHADKDAKWAAAVIEKAHGPERKGFQTFVDALHAGRTGEPGALEKLVSLARDTAAPDIARATAVADLQRFPGPGALAAIQLGLMDHDALVRVAALDALLSVPPQDRARLAEPLADDPVKAVRIKAGRALAAARLEGLSPEQRSKRERAFAEYVAAQEAVAERPESHANLGAFYAERGDAQRAEVEYRNAIRLQPDFVPAYANLADLYRALNRDADATTILNEGLREVPNDPSLLHAQGLLRIREKNLPEALALLKRAAEGQPANARFAYVYAVALNSAGKPGEAIAALSRALERSPYDPDLLFGMTAFNRDAGKLPVARDYARRLTAVAPQDARAQVLARELGIP